jgi:hypothetical protein
MRLEHPLPTVDLFFASRFRIVQAAVPKTQALESLVAALVGGVSIIVLFIDTDPGHHNVCAHTALKKHY